MYLPNWKARDTNGDEPLFPNNTGITDNTSIPIYTETIMIDKNIVSSTEARLAWIEPTVTDLDVRETAIYPSGGGDGQKNFPDCTRS